MSWLDFETELEVRRLWSFPDDWARLTSAQLERLVERASTVIARFPRPRRADEDGAGCGHATGSARSRAD